MSCRSVVVVEVRARDELMAVRTNRGVLAQQRQNVGVNQA